MFCFLDGGGGGDCSGGVVVYIEEVGYKYREEKEEGGDCWGKGVLG